MSERQLLLEVLGSVIGQGDAAHDEAVVAAIDEVERMYPQEDLPDDTVMYVEGSLGDRPMAHYYDNARVTKTVCGQMVRYRQGTTFILARHALRFAKQCTVCNDARSEEAQPKLEFDSQ